MTSSGDASNEIRVDPRLFPFMKHLAPGVVGSKFDNPGEPLVITSIFAESPGNGDVRRFLNSLPRNRVIRIPTVLNPRLREMLARRGFGVQWEQGEDGPVEWFMRREEDVL